MRTPFFLITFILIGLNLISQINQIPGIVIQNDFDFNYRNEALTPFHDDYILIHSYDSGQIWLTNGIETETHLLLNYFQFGSIVNIQVVNKEAFIFTYAASDSLIHVFSILNRSIRLDTSFKVTGYPGDFCRINDLIYFTTLNTNFIPVYKYHYYSIASKVLRQISQASKVSLISPLNWKEQLYYMGAVKGHQGTWLVKYDMSLDSMLPIVMLDSANTYSEKKLILKEKDFYYCFISFTKFPQGGIRHYLIRSDGSSQGTYKIKEIEGPDYFPDREAIVWNNKLYFSGIDPYNTLGAELYISDGTSSGTHLVKDLDPGSYFFTPGNFVRFSNELVFSSIYNFTLNPLYITNGTTSGTRTFANEYKFVYGPITNKDDTLIFCGKNNFMPGIGNEIYFYTKDGTINYFDINRTNKNFGNSEIYQTVLTQNNVFFAIDDGSGFIRPYVYHRGTPVKNSDVESIDDDLFLYPNPFKEHLYFNKKVNTNEISKITVVTENGIEINLDHWDGNKVNVKNLLPGFYKILMFEKDKLKFSGSFSKVE